MIAEKFHWEKKGLLFEPVIPGFTHGSHPCITHKSGNEFVVAFTCRDAEKRSHIFLSGANVSDGVITLTGQPKLVLSPGEPGYFDCDGIISGCLVPHQGICYLYFVGWQNLPEGMWICDTGRAIVDIEKLEAKKEYPGPVLGRDKTNPLFAAATAFHVSDEGRWHAWFNSGIYWKKTAEGWHHRYGFHHAESDDGVDWICETKMCIPFADEYEYAFGRPSVVYWDNLFHMWFAHRATKEIDTYRMGFASSKDGINWDRNDAVSGIDVSSKGWDSEMICYPSVFAHEGRKYMLYNGNGYGSTGFGYAVLEDRT